jgi:hypothetical protein
VFVSPLSIERVGSHNIITSLLGLQGGTAHFHQPLPIMKFATAVALMLAASANAFAPVLNTNAGTSSALSMSKVERNPNFAKLAGGYVRFFHIQIDVRLTLLSD